jgi:general secretion pathway protein K
MRTRQKQGGVALLAAILLVAVATVLAATIAFQSAMAARRGAASMTFEQSALIAQGAEALAAYFLREDGNGKRDDLGEAWAKPFGPQEIFPGVVLTAYLTDLQGRFNLNSLVLDNGKVDQDAMEIFRQLLQRLELEPKWANEIADWIDEDGDSQLVDGLEDNGTTTQEPPYRTANTVITSASELLALPGFGRERYLKLAPYVAALPPGTTVNVCTARPQLLEAIVGPTFQRWSKMPDFEELRQKGCGATKDQVEDDLNLNADGIDPQLIPSRKERIEETASYFRLTSIVTIGGNEFALYSLLQRERAQGNEGPTKIRVLQRSFTPD